MITATIDDGEANDEESARWNAHLEWLQDVLLSIGEERLRLAEQPNDRDEQDYIISSLEWSPPSEPLLRIPSFRPERLARRLETLFCSCMTSTTLMPRKVASSLYSLTL